MTESSAKTYRLLQRNQTDPFDFDDIVLTQRVLYEVTHNNDTEELLNSTYGHFPGTWSLPVCDISGYGAAWNFDYVTKDQPEPITLTTGAVFSPGLPHPPCMCGEGGNETLSWSQAAGMTGFQTFYDRCKRVIKTLPGLLA